MAKEMAYYFERNINIESEIDDILLGDMRYSFDRFYYLQPLMNRIERLVKTCNDSKYDERQLINTLTNIKDEKFTDTLKNSEHNKYIEKIKEYIRTLKEDFHIKENNNFYPLSYDATSITNDYLFFLSQSSSSRRDFNRTNYGWYTIYKNVIYKIVEKPDIFLLDKKFINHFNESSSISDLPNKMQSMHAVVIIINNDHFTDEFKINLFSHEKVIGAMVIYGNNNTYFHSLNYLILSFRSFLWSILKKYDDNNAWYIDRNKVVTLKKTITKLNTIISTETNYIRPIRYNQIQFDLDKSQIVDYSVRLYKILSTFDGEKYHLERIAFFINYFKSTNYNINTASNIDYFIRKSLYTISANRYLYKRQKKGDIHNELNLSSLLKTLLDLSLDSNTFIVTQEEMNGAGNSDIEIKFYKHPLVIIETKLVLDGHTLEKSVTTGLEQLYNRYSNRLEIFKGHILNLYLVIFYVDPDIAIVRKKIESIISRYCERNTLDFKLNEAYDRSSFSVTFTENYINFGKRSQNIEIIICRLENEPNLDRLNLKSFDNKKQFK
ncbi:hypothetical protein NDL23_002806 [Salmonella enterica subsp. enterica serovar Newport]|nr:hypothetical protein [Salmonella enterica subsp. enterica serovar Newport]